MEARFAPPELSDPRREPRSSAIPALPRRHDQDRCSGVHAPAAPIARRSSLAGDGTSYESVKIQFIVAAAFGRLVTISLILPWILAATFGAICIVLAARLRDLRQRRASLADSGSNARMQVLGAEQAEHEEPRSGAPAPLHPYADVIDSIREVVFRTDRQMRFVFLNRAWETTSGEPIIASIGQALPDYLHPDDHDGVVAQLTRLLAGELDEYRGQIRLRTHEGEIRWIDATARLVRNHDERPEHLSIVGTFDDISSGKIAEMTLRNINLELEARVRMRTAELEASNRELEAFSYSVSHDLRAPLRSIDGFTRIIEEELGDRLDPGARENLERIRSFAARMAHLTDDLIELARFSRHPLRKENVDLSEMALQIIEDLRAQEPSRTVEVEITSDLIVTADRSLMRVVLENLLGNAWKFTSRCEVARISFRADISGERRVFAVSDNGVGFDMAFAANLFRAFDRMHHQGEFPGSGIGLANVHRIIQRLGGQIWATAAPDEGATFHFTLDA